MKTLLIRERYKVVRVITAQPGYALLEAVDILDRETPSCLLNLYEGDLHLEKGVPQTTNSDKSLHGFGIKSMMMTVKKYGGTISFKAENGTFNVNILFTLPDPSAAPKGASA